jgi:dolichol-phosphate mannosyltransferase
MGHALVIIPTYNEKENLPRLVEEVLALDEELHILVIDDGSPDGTGQIANALAERTGRVAVIHRAGKQGLGTAYVAGFRHALSAGHEYIVQMDADFSHRPVDLPRLLEAVETADVAIGSRNVRGGQAVSWSPFRDLLSKGGSLYARTLLSLPIRDCTSGFKCFRRSALQALDLDGLNSNGFGFQVEVNYALARAGMRFVEVPIIFPDRTQGKSKMSGRIVLEAALLVLRFKLGLNRPALAHKQTAPASI